MAYADFTLTMVNERLGIKLVLGELFASATELEPSPWLRQTLAKAEKVSLTSEKSRSEFIVAPILLECQEQSGDRISVHSGERLDVDSQRGLLGVCDFILSVGPRLPVVQAPIAILLEAKRGIIEEGLGQCGAQMVAAQVFNEKIEGRQGVPIFGCVTSGDVWQFMRLDGSNLTIDDNRYYLSQLAHILGIFKAMLASCGVGTVAA